MSSLYLNFIKKLLIFSLLIGFLISVCIYTLPSAFITPALPYLLLFFFAIASVSHYFQIKAGEKSFIRFTSSYMLVTFIKLILLMSVLLLYVFNNRKDAIPFIVWFFLFYILFSAFEVIELQKLKKND